MCGANCLTGESNYLPVSFFLPEEKLGFGGVALFAGVEVFAVNAVELGVASVSGSCGERGGDLSALASLLLGVCDIFFLFASRKKLIFR